MWNAMGPFHAIEVSLLVLPVEESPTVRLRQIYVGRQTVHKKGLKLNDPRFRTGRLKVKNTLFTGDFGSLGDGWKGEWQNEEKPLFLLLSWRFDCGFVDGLSGFRKRFFRGGQKENANEDDR